MEKILLFHGDTETERKVRNVANRLKMNMTSMSDPDSDSLLEDLAQGREVSQDVSANPEASLLLLCGLREKRLDKLLFELRREEVTVEYKAILTPVNRTWTLRHLYLEMQREKAAISRKSSEFFMDKHRTLGIQCILECRSKDRIEQTNERKHS